MNGLPGSTAGGMCSQRIARNLGAPYPYPESRFSSGTDRQGNTRASPDKDKEVGRIHSTREDGIVLS